MRWLKHIWHPDCSDLLTFSPLRVVLDGRPHGFVAGHGWVGLQEGENDFPDCPPLLMGKVRLCVARSGTTVFTGDVSDVLRWSGPYERGPTQLVHECLNPACRSNCPLVGIPTPDPNRLARCGGRICDVNVVARGLTHLAGPCEVVLDVNEKDRRLYFFAFKGAGWLFGVGGLADGWQKHWKGPVGPDLIETIPQGQSV